VYHNNLKDNGITCVKHTIDVDFYTISITKEIQNNVKRMAAILNPRWWPTDTNCDIVKMFTTIENMGIDTQIVVVGEIE